MKCKIYYKDGNMQRQCAWCKEHMGFTEDKEDFITHGICIGCKNLLKETSLPLEKYKEFSDLVPEPTFVVSNQGIVKGINSTGIKELGLTQQDIERPGGEVFKCINAFRGGGCGQNEECKSCPIRTKVINTFKTGEGHLKESGIMSLQNLNAYKNFKVTVTTERVGDYVLLRVDGLEEV